MSQMKNLGKFQGKKLIREVSDYLVKFSSDEEEIYILWLWKVMKKSKSALTQCAKNVLAISAADVEVKWLFSIIKNVIIYHWNHLNSDIIEQIMLVKYYDLYTLTSELADEVEKHSIFTASINSDNDDSSADEMNKTSVKPQTEIISKSIELNDDLYDYSDDETSSHTRHGSDTTKNDVTFEVLEECIIINFDSDALMNSWLINSQLLNDEKIIIHEQELSITEDSVNAGTANTGALISKVIINNLMIDRVIIINSVIHSLSSNNSIQITLIVNSDTVINTVFKTLKGVALLNQWHDQVFRAIPSRTSTQKQKLFSSITFMFSQSHNRLSSRCNDGKISQSHDLQHLTDENDDTHRSKQQCSELRLNRSSS